MHAACKEEIGKNSCGFANILRKLVAWAGNSESVDVNGKETVTRGLMPSISEIQEPYVIPPDDSVSKSLGCLVNHAISNPIYAHRPTVCKASKAYLPAATTHNAPLHYTPCLK